MSVVDEFLQESGIDAEQLLAALPKYARPEPRPDLSAPQLQELLAQAGAEQPLAWESLLPLIEKVTPEPYFPKAALDYVQQHWAHYRPYLYQVLDQCVSAPDRELPDDYCLHIFAGCMLAQYRDAQCFDLAQKLAMFSDAQLMYFIGDSAADVIPAWLAAWCHGSPEHLQWLRELSLGAHQHHWYMRHLGAAALCICAAEGVVSFEQLAIDMRAHCEMFIENMKQEIEQDPADPSDIFGADNYMSYAVCSWMDACMLPEELPRVKSWFDADFLDQSTVRFDTVERQVHAMAARASEGESAYPSPLAARLPKPIEQEIGWWEWFQERPAPSLPMPSPWAPYEPEPISLPYIRPEPKVGRNDPCTCGSGKKYKKCCGA